jgi:hypothetical protein
MQMLETKELELEEALVIKEIMVVQITVVKVVKVLQAVLQDHQSHTLVVAVDLLGVELKVKADLAAADKADKI